MANAALSLLPAEVKAMSSSNVRSQVSYHGERKCLAAGLQANG